MSIEIRTNELNALIADLTVQLNEAKAREQLVVGKVYSVHVGKGETAALIEAVLIGQRDNANGVPEFRFSHGEGFNARFFDVSFSKVVTDVEGMSSNKIGTLLTRAKTNLENVATYTGKIKSVKTPVELVVGQTYQLKTGKGETAAVVPAALIAQRLTESGSMEYAVFFGSGFDAKVLHIGYSRFVFDKAAEAVAEDSGIDLDAEYEEAPAVTPEYDAQ
jgi:hypothetical protein